MARTYIRTFREGNFKLAAKSFSKRRCLQGNGALVYFLQANHSQIHFPLSQQKRASLANGQKLAAFGS
jgi:hypothetical protein